MHLQRQNSPNPKEYGNTKRAQKVLFKRKFQGFGGVTKKTQVRREEWQKRRKGTVRLAYIISNDYMI